MFMQPITTNSPFQMRRIIAILLGLALVVPCAALPRFLRAKKSVHWPTAEGVMTVSRLVPGHFKQMKGYYGVIQYRYRIGSADYTGTRLSFNRLHLSVKDAWQRVLDTYPVGKTVKVYYNPEQPTFAVLEPGLTRELDLTYKMDIFFIAGFALTFLIALHKSREPAN
jgi:hypothetical protein